MNQSLSGLLLETELRELFHAECVSVIQAYVQAQAGVRGFVLRAAASALRAVREDGLLEAARALSPDFTEALEPLFQEYRETGGRLGDFGPWLVARRERAADALLDRADHEAGKSAHPLVRRFYAGLREGAREDVVELVPEIAGVLERLLRVHEVVQRPRRRQAEASGA